MLTELTGHDQRYWFARVQALIGKHTTRRKGARHGRTDASAWMRDLTKEILASFPKDGQYDGNMRLAVCGSLILAHWYARVHRAKMMDPRRPLARSEILERWIAVATEYGRIFLDESADPELLEQPWNNPFWPHRRGGKFV